jgi:hypothetical protein
MTKYELTIKDPTKIKFNINKIAAPAHLHLTDKPDNASPFVLAPLLKDYSLTITFALRNHYHFGKLKLITEELDKYLIGIRANSNIKELLVVSGSNRGEVDSLSMLDYLSSINSDINIGVAYNCNIDNQEEENKRLASKLAHSCVKSVYIQITDNLGKIERGIMLIRSLRPDVRIAICVVKPSHSLFNSLKLRPWKGVVLSEQYLNNLNFANSTNDWNIKELKHLDIDTLMTF